MKGKPVQSIRPATTKEATTATTETTTTIMIIIQNNVLYNISDIFLNL